MTIANLGLAVDSSSVATATPELQKMTAASVQAEAAAERLGAASRSGAAGTAAATAATKMHTVALQAQAAASRMVANDSRMLAFQLNDVVVSLASGMNPGMVLLQQGSQISQLGLRNVGVAALSMARNFAPAIAAAGALSIGVASLTTEINRNQSAQVSWLDTLTAGWQLASEWFFQKFDPIVDWFGGLWDAVSPGITNWLLNTVANVDLTVRNLGTLWGALPGIVGEASINAANAVLGVLDDLLNKHRIRTQLWLTQMSTMLGPILGAPFAGANMALAGMPDVKFTPLDNPFAGSLANSDAAMAQNRQDVMNTDYLGLIGERARKIAAAAGMDDDDKKTKKAAAGVRSITDEFEKLQGKVMGVREVITGVFGDMGSVIADSFRKGGNVALNMLDAILGKVANVGESLMNAGLNGLLNAGLNALTGSLTGSMSGFSYGPSVFSDPWGGMRAAGGPVDAGKAYIVGEKRPEVFVPRTSGNILPSVPNGMTVNISISGSKQDAAAIAQSLRPVMLEVIRKHQKNPDRAY
jgi:hypothetical protein